MQFMRISERCHDLNSVAFPRFSLWPHISVCLASRVYSAVEKRRAVDGMGKVKKEKNAKNLQDKVSEVEFSKKHKNFEKNRASVEDGTRKYGYISANSVISMAESAGFTGIQEDVAKNLAEDVTYRLRYIIQQCKKYMIHSKRKKLRSADINEVLRMCDTPAVYGYTVDKPLHNFIYIKEADVFVLDDNVIDLPSFALNDAVVLKRQTSFATGMWLKVEEKISSKSLLHCESLRLGNESEENETKIPTSLIKYYGITCNTLLGHSDLKVIFQDLSSNSRIIPIVPYLLNFITIALNKLSSERQLQRLLQTVEALSKNTNVDFTPYSATTRVINAMLLIVAGDKKLATPGHNFQLKAYAANVLSLVLSQWCLRDEQRQMIVRKMGNLLCDFKVPAKVHYGALALLTALGPEALSAGLWKTLKQYLGYLGELKLASDCKTGNDCAMLEEIMLTAAVSLYRCAMNEAVLSELDGYLCSYFGDAVCPLRTYAPVCRPPHDFGNAETDKAAEKKLVGVFKCITCQEKPTVKTLSAESVFALPRAPKRKNTRIIFKFAGAIPVPEINLKRRKFYSHYSKSIPGNGPKGNVAVAGKRPRGARAKPHYPAYCLLSVL